MEQKTSFQVVFTPEPEGGFTVTIPALPGCISYGKDLVEARDMIVDAISGYLVSVAKHHSETDETTIPLTTGSFIGMVIV